MSGLVTRETDRSVIAFINTLSSVSKQEDSKRLLSLINEITGHKAKIWGNEKAPDFIIGFGKYQYKRKGSNEVLEWFNIGFAPRKSKTTIYLNVDLNEEDVLLRQLGKCKWGKGCLYINKLDDIDIDCLRSLIEKNKNARWH